MVLVQQVDKMKKLTSEELEAFVTALIKECQENQLSCRRQIAYILATVEWETAKTFQPVVESYWEKNPANYNKITHPEYYPYYGRGYVQLTWKQNYKKFSDIVGKDLVKNPDLVLNPEIALKILVYGFKHGSFSGAKLENYITKNSCDYKHARKCINGNDKACDIASLAEKWEQILLYKRPDISL